nr:MAG TPA: hypothetical protein [Caudoviricetes sp.]
MDSTEERNIIISHLQCITFFRKSQHYNYI